MNKQKEDLRVKKTKQSIRYAFLELCKKKSVSKMTVTELSNLAMINKGTFYLHYQDIFALYLEIMKGLDSKLSELETKATQVATTANKAVSGPKGLNEKSPSKLWRKYGAYAVEGLELGFKDQMSSAQNVIYDMVDNFTDVLDFSQKDNGKLGSPTAYAYEQQIYTGQTEYCLLFPDGAGERRPVSGGFQ